jgi:hypothetical protein
MTLEYQERLVRMAFNRARLREQRGEREVEAALKLLAEAMEARDRDEIELMEREVRALRAELTELTATRVFREKMAAIVRHACEPLPTRAARLATFPPTAPKRRRRSK